jgi:hypothetical protein
MKKTSKASHNTTSAYYLLFAADVGSVHDEVKLRTLLFAIVLQPPAEKLRNCVIVQTE